MSPRLCSLFELQSEIASGVDLSCGFSHVLRFNLLVISIPLFFAAPHWQQLGMAGRKREVINKIQTLFAQPISDSVSGVLSAELTKFCRINDRPFAIPSFYLACFKPAAADPFLDLLRTHMESDSVLECVVYVILQKVGEETVQSSRRPIAA